MLTCPSCGLRNRGNASACVRCGAVLQPTSGEQPQRASRVESIASVLYLVACALSCAGGGAVIALLGALFGQKAMDNDQVLIWGFMVGTVGSLGGMVMLTNRWKARALGQRPPVPATTRSETPPQQSESRKELVGFAIGLAAFGAIVVYYFTDLEASGGERRINAAVYGLYLLLGKWGLAALIWSAAAALVWTAFRRRN